MSKLQTFLDAKPLFYDEIDLERMPKVYKSIYSELSIPKIIHIVGTNGKGTTGRFLANALLQNDLKVGHYTSPHILSFNERIWIDGANVKDAVLEEAHTTLLGLLTTSQAECLSYFEYTTLLAMVVYKECDYVVLEAGLGGEFDATNVFDKVLSLFTPIDLDHQSFLGDTLEEIAATKFRSMQESAVLGVQPHREVITVFDKIVKEKECHSWRIETLLSSEEIEAITQTATSLDLASYLQQNLLLSMSALKFLGVDADVAALAKAPLFGRLTQLRKNVLLDVGHNVLAAQAIVETLRGSKYILVYNSYRDKDYQRIVQTLKPIVEHIELIDVWDVRIEQKGALQSVIEAEGISVHEFDTIKADKNYLVFGSFSVAEAFLEYLAGQ